tara:strand:+ start:5123 stop:5233 length:111 start_codon:yes stop_codon:yes gene_type:complete
LAALFGGILMDDRKKKKVFTIDTNIHHIVERGERWI